MLRFAVKTLLADRGKLLVAFVGVVFSLVLVNIQGGLFLGMIGKASLLVDHSEADIWVGHRGLENVDLPYEIPESWLDRVRSVEGVEVAEPYIVSYAHMTMPNGEYEGVWVIGSEPSSTLGGPWGLSDSQRDQLRRPDAIAVDKLDGWKLGNPNIGDTVEINGHRARVTTQTEGILGFLTTPYVFTTLDSARRYTRTRPGYCSFYLVEVDESHDPAAVRREIRQRVPELDVYTSAELSEMSRSYWMNRTGLGQSFGGATILGLIVGLVIVAQSLYALVLDHLNDFAALKAIGAEDRHVFRVLIIQAALIAVIGSAVGTVLTWLIQTFGSTTFAPIDVPLWLRLAGFALVLLICLLSSVLPYLRVRRVDPAVVLQG